MVLQLAVYVIFLCEKCDDTSRINTEATPLTAKANVDATDANFVQTHEKLPRLRILRETPLRLSLSKIAKKGYHEKQVTAKPKTKEIAASLAQR